MNQVLLPLARIGGLIEYREGNLSVLPMCPPWNPVLHPQRPQPRESGAAPSPTSTEQAAGPAAARKHGSQPAGAGPKQRWTATTDMAEKALDIPRKKFC